MKAPKPPKKTDALQAESREKPQTLSPAARRPLLPALVWLGLVALSLILTGCPRFTPLYAVYLGLGLLLLGGELFFLDGLYRKGKTRLYLGWKKFTGYSLPLYYFAHALPRVEWQNLQLIGQGRGTFIFVLTLLATAAGGFVFFLAGRPSAFAAFGLITAEELADPALRKRKAKEKKKRSFLAGSLEWVDALAWAAIAVLIVNIFVFQLYVVPSESMVPAFLVGDRPFTLKAASGPRIPLTEWRLPFLRLPRRGDVVTIANPRYPENHRVDLKKYVSQLVYMITFTTVNLDATLPDGTPKADPLVKRIVGEPGDKLMMVDDSLYVRRSGDAQFRKLEEPWARVDLWKESPALRAKIQSMPMDETTRALLSFWDRRKNEAEPEKLGAELAASLGRIEANLGGLKPSLLSSFFQRELPRADPGLRSRLEEAVALAAKGEDPFSSGGSGAEDLSLALAAASSAEARAKLRAFLEGGLAASALPSANAYEAGSRSLSLLIKANLAARIDRDLEILASGGKIEAFGADARRARLVAEARELYIYVQGYYDSRNFPAFPAGEDFLGRDEYFAMGDNRYNSLDFRFATSQKLRALDPGDPRPILYNSMLEPFPVRLKFIEGYALFRLWPPSRLGKIR